LTASATAMLSGSGWEGNKATPRRGLASGAMSSGPQQRSNPRRAIVSFARDSGVVLIGEGFARLTAFLAIPLAAIFLTDDELGRVALGVVIFALLTGIYSFGLQTAVIRFHFVDENDHSIWWLVMLVIAILLPATYLIAPWVADVVFTEEATSQSLTLIPLAAAAAAVIGVGMSSLKARFAFGRFSVLSVARAAGGAIPPIIGAAVTGNATGYFVGLAAGLVPLALIVLAANAKRIGAPSRTLWVPALIFALPLIPHFLFGVVLNLADRLVLERYTSVAEVGRYALAYQLAWGAGALANALNHVWGPILYRRQEQNGTSAADRLVALVAAPSAAATALLAVVSVVLAQVVYDLLRDTGKPDLIVFAAVAAGSVMFGTYLINVGPAFLRDLTWLIPLGTGTGAVVNVAANFALVPKYGANGAAIATFLAYGASASTIAVAQISRRFAPLVSKRLALVTGIELVFAAIALAVLGPWSIVPIAVMAGAPAVIFYRDLSDLSRVAVPPTNNDAQAPS